MRKFILLALAALVAGTVYAETSPAFSGSFEFLYTMDVFGVDIDDKDRRDHDEALVIKNNYDTKIAVNGVIDEWTTVNAEITKERFEVAERILRVERKNATTDKYEAVSIAANTVELVRKDDKIITDMDSYTIDNTGDDKFGANIANLIDPKNSDNVYDTDEYDTLVLNEFTMTNDLTGALGFADSPVGVSITWGKTSLSPASFQGVAKIGYLDHDATDSYLGAKVALTILEKVKLVGGIFPSTYMSDFYEEGRDKAPVYGIDLQMLELVEGLNFNLFVTMDANEDTDDDTLAVEETKELGLTAGYSGLENWNFGLATSYDLFVEEFDIGVSASYDLLEGRLSTALGVVTEFSKDKKVEYKTNKVELTTPGDPVSETNPQVVEKKTAEIKVKEPIRAFIGLDVRFKAVPDVLDIVFNLKLPMKGDQNSLGYYMNNEVSFDAGVEAYLGSVTYGLGYELRDRNTYSPNGDDSTGVYFKVKASF